MSAVFILVFLFQSSYSVRSGSPGVPAGHLMPFGFHKPPSVVIPEYNVENAPDPETFFKNHVNISKAAIFRGAVRDSDAFKLWTDEYIREHFGELEVRMEGKKEKVSKVPPGEKYMGRDTLRHFVDHYHEESNFAYVVSDLPSTMHHQVGVLPSLGACGEMARSFVEIDIWWSGGQSRSVIHKDSFNQMNCLLNGTKYWKLIENKYEKDLYKHPEHYSEVGGFSDINVVAVDLLSQPKVKNIEWSNFTINKGDCLFLPKSYYHQVNSIETHNMAVSILFRRFDKSPTLDFSDCTEDTDYRRVRRLTEFDIMWPYNGTGEMSMGNGDLEEQYRDDIMKQAQRFETQGARFGPKQLIEWYDILPSKNITEAFNNMDYDKDGSLSVEEAKKWTWKELREFAANVEAFSPSNSYELEYDTVDYEQLLNTFHAIRTRMTELTRKKWIEIYKTFEGMESTANDVFDRLGGGKETIVCKDIGDKDIDHALYRWVKFREEHPRISGIWHGDDEEDEDGDRHEPGNREEDDEELQLDEGDERENMHETEKRQEL